MKQRLLETFSSGTCTLKKWCTIDIWWLIYTFYDQNWQFLKFLCVCYHYWKIFTEETFLFNFYFERKKNWCIIDLSSRIYTFYIQIWCFCIFGLVFKMKKILLRKLFSLAWTLTGNNWSSGKSCVNRWTINWILALKQG